MVNAGIRCGMVYFSIPVERVPVKLRRVRTATWVAVEMVYEQVYRMIRIW